ncbi:NAD-dependent succinate-semialdehyde dehydrogenase [Oceanobacillus damuensis]|uniref:NAD-dependent succinate-semialdehyde dehydrogenase n=1 Tax=Oceanobacillus damuensis TaxID=937928 RepID=UPI00083219A6|nr:NAD-dependent succinate-semialdehyde dehydrogenase [Oceanobacillus damuensis]
MITNKLYINGEWMDALSKETFPSINPSTGEIIAVVPKAGGAETKLAIDAAYNASKEWAKTTVFKRSELLHKIKNLILENSESLTRLLTMEQGKPLYEAEMEVNGSAKIFELYAEEAKRINGETLPNVDSKKRNFVNKVPIGVVAAITPWNFPLHILCRKISAALAAGCPVLVKPASDTPLIALALAKLFEEAGFPKGVANFIVGDTKQIGNEIFNSPKVAGVSFTGSTAVGKKIIEACASTVKHVSMELGGHAPIIVYDDADIDLAVEGTLINKLRNSGQTCVCANRIYVHKNVVEEYTTKLAEKMNKKTQGNGLDNTDLGSLVNEEAISKIETHVKDALDKGATLVTGGSRNKEMQTGYYYLPTILQDIHEEMELMKDETFGPVAPIIEFDDDEKIIERVNNTPNGLAAYFYTNNLKKVYEVSEQLEFGVVGVNDTTPVVDHGPFGGVKQSGIGREGGKEGIEEFLDSKAVSIRLEK